MKSSLAVIALMGALVGVEVATPEARADTFDEPLPSLVVHFDRSELASKAGTDRVYRRLHSAAREACQSYSSKELAQQWRLRLCIERSLAYSVVQINDQALNSYYELRTGKSAVSSAAASGGGILSVKADGGMSARR
jgi:UrcA family protein